MISEIEYKGSLQTAYMLARLAYNLPLDEMLAAAHHSEAIGWVLDPTLYRNNLRKLQQDIAVLESLANLKRLMEPYINGVKEEV